MTNTPKTLEEKKAWLRSYQALCRELERTQEELAQWRSRAEQVTRVCSGLPAGGGRGDRLPQCVEQIAQLEEELAQTLIQLTISRKALEQAIFTVPQQELRQLLRYRYIDGLTLERTAEAMGYSHRQAWRLQCRAIDAVRLEAMQPEKDRP